jgi:hypothetical protein
MPAKTFAGHRDGTRTSRVAILYEPTESIKLDPQNARNHTKKQIGQIARSMTTFGNIVPILVGPDLYVIAGHGRLLAARQLGFSEVPIIPVEHLTPAQIRAFQIADNRLTEIATWDNRLLGETLRELNALDLDFSLEVTEMDPLYVDTAIRRWQAYTGEAATHAATGRSFDEISRTLGNER